MKYYWVYCIHLCEYVKSISPSTAQTTDTWFNLERVGQHIIPRKGNRSIYSYIQEGIFWVLKRETRERFGQFRAKDRGYPLRGWKDRYMSIHEGFVSNAICVVMPSFSYRSFSQSTSITSYILYLLSKLIVKTVLFVIRAENHFKRS